MTLSRTLRSPLGVVAAAAAVTAALSAPVFANADANVGTQIDYSRPLRQVIPAVQMVQLNRNLDLRTRNVALTCEGVAVGDAVSMRMVECALYIGTTKITNEPLATPGVAVVSATVSQLIPVGSAVYGCVTVNAGWSDTTSSPNRRSCTAPQIARA